MNIIDDDKTECSRCDTVVHLAEVVVLEQQVGKGLLKPLCEPCLDVVGVPVGYTLERDVTYLARDS